MIAPTSLDPRDLALWVASTDGGKRPVPPSALLTSLAAYWPLSDLTDSLGVQTLTNNNAVTFAAGKVGNAASFAAASSQSLSRASNAVLQTGDIDYWLWGWLYANDAGTDRCVVAKDNFAALREYILYRTAGNKLELVTFNGVATVTGVATSTASISASAWTFFFAYHDAANDEVGVSLDGGAFVTSATTGAGGAGTADFQIGARAGGVYWDGLLDEIGYGKSASAYIGANKTTLRDLAYNGGAGRTYPF